MKQIAVRDEVWSALQLQSSQTNIPMGELVGRMCKGKKQLLDRCLDLLDELDMMLWIQPNVREQTAEAVARCRSALIVALRKPAGEQ